MSANRYNLKSQKRLGWTGAFVGLTRESPISDITERVGEVQKYLGLSVDHKLGPATFRALARTWVPTEPGKSYPPGLFRKFTGRTQFDTQATHWPVLRPSAEMIDRFGYSAKSRRTISAFTNSGHIGNRSRAFGATRRNNRRHTGMDVYATEGDVVVATEPGFIVNHYGFTTNVDCLIVQKDSGVTVNYGEIHRKSWVGFGLKKGSRVVAGQPIALVGRMKRSSMLHFELYEGSVKRNYRWYTNKKTNAALADPTVYLAQLSARGK